MTEAGLQLEVQDLCWKLGLPWHHCRDSRKCAGVKGFPDLVIAGRGGLLIAELKSADGETSADQQEWLWRLSNIGSDVRIREWGPEHLESGAIRAELEGLADSRRP